jgi:hypothetical protein
MFLSLTLICVITSDYWQKHICITQDIMCTKTEAFALMKAVQEVYTDFDK